MEKRTHNFLKGLGILFAVAAGIGTAVLGYVDRTDWIQVAFYSVAVAVSYTHLTLPTKRIV